MARDLAGFTSRIVVMDSAVLFRAPYVINILILIPVCAGMLSGSGAAIVFEGKVEGSRGLELLIASLWFSILLASFAGLAFPRTMAPLLAIQTIYKALWLGLFVAPLLARGQGAAVPWGVSGVFLAIVVVWPVFLWLAWRNA